MRARLGGIAIAAGVPTGRRPSGVTVPGPARILLASVARQAGVGAWPTLVVPLVGVGYRPRVADE